MKHVAVAAIACAFLALGWLSGSGRPVYADGRSARHASITEGLDCSLCHTTASWKSLSDTGGKGFDHARTGFPLTGQHRRTPCTGCHHGTERITRQCTGCHRDPHDERLGSDCSDCHSSISFQQVASFERHRLTRLPLTGMHALIECTECHRRTTEREWSSVPADCYACHAKDYRRSDIHPLHTGGSNAAPFPHDCAQCHRASAWSPAFVDPRALRQLVGSSVMGLTQAPLTHELLFPIRQGKHRGTTCEDCHRSPTVPQALRCTGCHAHNPVALQTQHRKQAAIVLDDGSCLACHRGGVRR